MCAHVCVAVPFYLNDKPLGHICWKLLHSRAASQFRRIGMVILWINLFKEKIHRLKQHLSFASFSLGSWAALSHGVITQQIFSVPSLARTRAFLDRCPRSYRSLETNYKGSQGCFYFAFPDAFLMRPPRKQQARHFLVGRLPAAFHHLLLMHLGNRL